MSAPGLTLPQQRILTTVRREGKHTYNGRATTAIAALEKLGLVEVDWDADLDHTKGRLRWHITVRPAPEPAENQAAITAALAEQAAASRALDQARARYEVACLALAAAKESRS